LVHVGTQGVVELISLPQCFYNTNQLANPISSVATTILSLFLFILNVILISFDIFLFIREKGCSLKRFFITDDPFGFRIEHLIMIFVFSFGSVVSFFPMGSYIVDLRSINSNADVYGWRVELTSAGISIFIFFVELGVLIASCSVGLIYSIISYFKSRNEPQTFDDEFIAFVNTKDGMKLLKKYSKLEWSSENVLFYEEILKFKQIKKPKTALKVAQRLKINYIESGSPLELNLSGDVRKLTIQNLSRLDSSNDISAYSDLFEGCLRETKRNMRDTYTRVRKTEEFKKWRNSSNVVVIETPRNTEESIQPK
jgi:hypothetical protein